MQGLLLCCVSSYAGISLMLGFPLCWDSPYAVFLLLLGFRITWLDSHTTVLFYVTFRVHRDSPYAEITLMLSGAGFGTPWRVAVLWSQLCLAPAEYIATAWWMSLVEHFGQISNHSIDSVFYTLPPAQVGNNIGWFYFIKIVEVSRGTLWTDFKPLRVYCIFSILWHLSKQIEIRELIVQN